MASAPKSSYALHLQFRIAELEIAIKHAHCAAHVLERKKSNLEELKAELVSISKG